MERPHVLKRLYVAIFCIVATAFLTVAAATYWWWLDVEIALVAFFCLGVFPVAFYTLLGTTVMDPGKTEGGGLIDRKSARFVDRFGRALMPLVIFTAIFGGLLASWWFPSVRKVVLQQTTALGFDRRLQRDPRCFARRRARSVRVSAGDRFRAALYVAASTRRAGSARRPRRARLPRFATG